MVVPEFPIVSKGASLALDLGLCLVTGGPDWGLGLDGGPWHFKITQLAAGGPVCKPIKFARATLHRRVRSPRADPFSLTGELTAVAPHSLRP